MPHETTFIATVATAFVLAFGFGYLADRLKFPPIVGYLLAGVMIGPFTPGYVADGKLAAELAEMGVILLMFGVGLHFSTADLVAVRWIAIPGALGQIFFATLLGIGLSALWGWPFGAGLILGLGLSVASTVVLLRALEERNLFTSVNGRIAVGWLIVEDLAMVLALVLIPTFSEVLGGHSAAHEPEGHLALTIFLTLGKVGIFVILAVVLGPRLVPWVLTHVARTGSRELFTLSVLALALGIAYGSAKIFGVSFALGAFFAGVVLSESRLSHKAAEESLPFQDAFSVLFFVSVGMLFDPSIILRDPAAVAAVLFLILLGKSFAGFLVVLLLRYPVATALTVSVSLAQIGEFSFILLGLGLSLGLVPPEGRDMIVAGALFSITLNPLLFSLSEIILRQSAWLRRGRIGSFGLRRYQSLEQELSIARKRIEEREQAHELRIRALAETFPVFSSLDDSEYDQLLLLFRSREVTPGTKIIRAGARGDALYFISSGNVEVLTGDRSITLEAGEIFGEMALLTGERRSADVVAVDYCQLLVLTRRDFNRFISTRPVLRQALRELAETRREMNRRPADDTGKARIPSPSG